MSFKAGSGDAGRYHEAAFSFTRLVNKVNEENRTETRAAEPELLSARTDQQV